MTTPAAIALCSKLLQVEPIPDGIFCYNDPVAIGAMKAITEAGLNIPDDIAVVGAGNVHYSDVLAVPLSTVGQGTVQIGKQAAELLMEQIGAERKVRTRRILIIPKMVVRQSSQPSGARLASEASPGRYERKHRPALRA
jgi:LacI family transcriptional regulator